MSDWPYEVWNKAVIYIHLELIRVTLNVMGSRYAHNDIKLNPEQCLVIMFVPSADYAAGTCLTEPVPLVGQLIMTGTWDNAITEPERVEGCKTSS